MTQFVLFAALWLVASCTADSHARLGPAADEDRAARPLFGTPGSTLISSGTATGIAARETAGPDTFVLYGGPDHPTEGKFQLQDRQTPDWGGGNGLPGGYGGGSSAWTPADGTYQRVYWHQDTYNAENLNSNGPGNHAMWCGLPAGDVETSGWVNPQGYGNGWSDGLIYVSDPVTDESVGQVVSLEFYLNYETEPDYDFVRVEFLRAGVWVEVGSATGTNADGGGMFTAPGVRFSDIQTAPIEYLGNDYAYEGLVSGGIVIRIRFESDSGWSDEDGLFVSDAGAAQVDDISLTTSQGSFFEDFEGAGPYLFRIDQQPFFGDFADVYPRISDLDPCRGNVTPVAGFLDYNQVVRNGPGASGTSQTGGEPLQGESYGIPGGWATPYAGLDADVLNENQLISPVIDLDLPGTDDDAPGFAGYVLRFDAWEHSGVAGYGDAGILYEWAVRFALPGEGFGSWVSDEFLYGLDTEGRWVPRRIDVSRFVPAGADRIQVKFELVDVCQFVFGCDPNSAAAPIFDNMSLTKYLLPGPVLSARAADQAQDGFPVSGSIDVSSSMTRGGLDVPFDMARDINDQGIVNVPGDSVTVDAVPIIPGTGLSDIRMVWALQTNALFEHSLRSSPARSKDENVLAGPVGTVWTGEVVAEVSTTNGGSIVENRYFADLPDADFMYPGDVLHYYFEATDTDGRVSTLPYDVSSFGDFSASSTFDRRFTVRALPALGDAMGSQPSVLLIDESGEAGSAPEIHASLRELGYAEGIDFDTYFVRSPGNTLGNGIGSEATHGASAAQLRGYNHILYLAGSLGHGLLSDGTSQFDKGNDIGTLEDWHALPGVRNTAYFGDAIATYHAQRSAETASYLAGTMGVNWLGSDVGGVIGGQTAPVVLAGPAWAAEFATSWVTYGGCPANNSFDQIQPLAGATAGHFFTDSGGTPIIDPSAGVASVIHATASGYEVTVPFSLSAIQGVTGRSAGPSARTALLGEILGLFGSAGGSPPVTAPTAIQIGLEVEPNPFNPRTVVRFTGVTDRTGSVKVYNLRGGLVRSLHHGQFNTAEFTWDGTDDAGAAVASGVYVVRAEADGTVRSAKVALVR